MPGEPLDRAAAQPAQRIGAAAFRRRGSRGREHGAADRGDPAVAAEPGRQLPGRRRAALPLAARVSGIPLTPVALRRRFPRLRFVWLMGADNLVQIQAWKDWQRIFNAVPVAVFTRPPYSYRALAAKAARRFAAARIDERASRTLPGRAAPAWAFLGGRPSPVSATARPPPPARPPH